MGIGWTHRQRAERLGLLVQNRRFLVLAETRMPNLASRALGLAARHLPEHWEAAHGYRPLLAETFTDIEAFEGTCYKASGWMPCGLTKGFERHRADFYREHRRPKKLWIKPLSREVRAALCGMELPPECRAGCDEQTPERALALSKAHLESLREALRRVPDPRAGNRSWPISVLLTTVCLGLLSGRKSLAAIHRYGQQLTPQQRGWLDFLPRRGGRPGRRAPSYQALYNLLRQLDAGALAAALAPWLVAHEGTLPRALAINGKYVRDLLLTLAFSEHESGAPVAVAIASEQPKSEESKVEGEITAAKRLYRSVDLRGATVTGDALHCERESMQMVVEGGGDQHGSKELIQMKRRWSIRRIFGESPATSPAIRTPRGRVEVPSSFLAFPTLAGPDFRRKPKNSSIRDRASPSGTREKRSKQRSGSRWQNT